VVSDGLRRVCTATSSRWHTLSLTMANDLLLPALLSNDDLPLHSLVRLELDFHGNEFFAFPKFSISESAVALRHLWSSYYLDPMLCDLAWSYLTSFKATDSSVSHCLQILRLCPQLTLCSVGLDGTTLTSAPPTQHPNLRYLNFYTSSPHDMTSMLHLLTLPALRHLCIFIAGGVTAVRGFPTSQLRSFLTRSCRLKKFTFDGPFTWVNEIDFMSCVSMAPLLEDVSMMCNGRNLLSNRMATLIAARSLNSKNPSFTAEKK
jgi:hypothetical protein